jgi:hypothetical protein
MVFLLRAQPQVGQRFLRPDTLATTPQTPVSICGNVFGNPCARLIAATGTLELSADGILDDLGVPERYMPGGRRVPVVDHREVYFNGPRDTSIEAIRNIFPAFDISWVSSKPESPHWRQSA